ETPNSVSRSFDGTPSMTITLTGSTTPLQTRPISASSSRPGMKKPDAPAATCALALSRASPSDCAASRPCARNRSVRALMKHATRRWPGALRMAATQQGLRPERQSNGDFPQAQQQLKSENCLLLLSSSHFVMRSGGYNPHNNPVCLGGCYEPGLSR